MYAYIKRYRILHKKSYDNVKNINNVYAYIEMYRNSKKFVGMRL